LLLDDYNLAQIEQLHGAWCMVHGAWCMVHGAWCMVPWCHGAKENTRIPSMFGGKMGSSHDHEHHRIIYLPCVRDSQTYIEPLKQSESYVAFWRANQISE
jgi:hypothetical protein